MAEERLQKILRSAGITSRRKAEALITAGRVRVDGQIVTEMGTKANPRRAKVELDGMRLQPEPFCYGVLHKPRGMLSTLSDPEGRSTAQDILKQVGVRVVPIGRLDFNTSGVLLFTNDGDFAQALSHASGRTEKVYAAKVQQIVDEASLSKWAEAIDIEGSMTRPAQIRILRREGEKTWLEVTLVEGKNRQVRRLGEHARTPVVRLSRLSHAEITAEGLRPGQWRLLSVDELKTLKKRYGVPKTVRPQGETLEAWKPKKHGSRTPQQALAKKTNEREPVSAKRGKPRSAITTSSVTDERAGGTSKGSARGRRPVTARLDVRRPGAEKTGTGRSNSVRSSIKRTSAGRSDPKQAEAADGRRSSPKRPDAKAKVTKASVAGRVASKPRRRG